VLSAILSSRDAYNSIVRVREERDFTEQGWILVQEIDNFYETDSSVSYVDVDVIKDIIARKYAKASGIINSVLDNMENVSVDNVVQEYIELKKDSLKHELADRLLTNEDYSDLMERLQTLDVIEEEDEHTLYIGTDIEDILQATAPENLIKVSPASLNDNIDGGLIPGTQVAIYAPTEVGKSMLSLHMCCGFLRNGHRVLYCGNEDPSKSMLLRAWTNLTQMTKEEIRKDVKTARKRAYANGYDNLIFKELTPGSLREVRSLVEKYKPEIVFVDQMANMECRSSSKVEKNEILACGLRAMAKKYQFVSIIIHQASDDAYGRNILEKNHLYYSNVGVQGQMDLMIGIGMDASYAQQGYRMLCLTKNKLAGKHVNFPVRVRPELSWVED